MAVKHAKTLTKQQLTATLRRAADSRYPDRDLVTVLLSVKAGLRAGEIAKLTWPMVVDAQGRIARHIELHDAAAKKRSGRTIPLHPDLRRSLRRLHKQNAVRGPVIRSERGEALRPSSVVNWFARLYRELDSRAAHRTRGAAPLSPMPPGSCSRRVAAFAMFSSWPHTVRLSTRKLISTVTRAPSAASSTYCRPRSGRYSNPLSVRILIV